MSEINGVDYWDMYFVLQLLPIPEDRVEVDIQAGTREHLVISIMQDHGHLFVSGDDTYIDAIASTKKGIKFFDYLVRIGFGTIQTEEYGRKVIESYENGNNGMMNLNDEDEGFEEEMDDTSEEVDPFLTSAARLMVVFGYDLQRLESALCIDPERFQYLKSSLITVGIIDSEGSTLVGYEMLEELFNEFSLE